MEHEEQRQAPNRGLTFVAKSQLLSSEEVERALRRMAHEIVERNHDTGDVTLIGLQTGGVAFAERLATLLGEIAAVPSLGLLDVSFYRDDLSLKPAPPSSRTTIDHDLTGRTVVVVDDGALYWTHDSSRAECTRRLGSSRCRPARRHGGPRSPRTAHSPRLRREEFTHVN